MKRSLRGSERGYPKKCQPDRKLAARLNGIFRAREVVEEALKQDTLISRITALCKDCDRPTARYVREIENFYFATQQAIDDDKLPHDTRICVAFDGSLVHPTLRADLPRGNYDTIGYNFFNLFEQYGHLTKYRLVLTSSAHDGMLAQMAKRVSVTNNHLETSDDLINIEDFRNELSSWRVASDQVQRGLDLQKNLIDRGLMNGTANKYEGLVGQASIDMNKISPIIQSIDNNKPQNESFNIISDRRIAADVVRFHETLDNEVLVYSGEDNMRMAFTDWWGLSRSPITVLVKLESLATASPSYGIEEQSIRYLRKASDAYLDILERILFYRNVGAVQEAEHNLIKASQHTYLKPLVTIKKKRYSNRDLNKEEVLEITNITRMKEHFQEKSLEEEEKIKEFWKIMPEEWDDRLYGSVDLLNHPDHVAYKERIHKKLRLSRS